MSTQPSYTSTTTHNGDMRCHTVYTDKHAQCTTDLPEGLGGKGEYPAPGSMLAACVASCMLSNIAHTGHVKGFETKGVRIHAGAKENTRGISSLHFDIEVTVPTTPEARRMMKAAAESCPVGRSISDKVTKEINWTWKEDKEE